MAETPVGPKSAATSLPATCLPKLERAGPCTLSRPCRLGGVREACFKWLGVYTVSFTLGPWHLRCCYRQTANKLDAGNCTGGERRASAVGFV